jgi:hypothetical protein
MALSNSQYNQLMRVYEQRQLDNEHRLARRYEEVYERIPKLRELDSSISSFSLKKARLLLDGNENHFRVGVLNDLVYHRRDLFVKGVKSDETAKKMNIFA